MVSFVKAEAEAAGAGDEVAKGMLYRAMAYIYVTIFDLGRAEEYADRARACYKLAGDMDKYAGALTFLSSIRYARSEHEGAITTRAASSVPSSVLAPPTTPTSATI